MMDKQGNSDSRVKIVCQFNATRFNRQGFCYGYKVTVTRLQLQGYNKVIENILIWCTFW